MNYFYRYGHGGLGIVSIVSIVQILLLFWVQARLRCRCPNPVNRANLGNPAPVLAREQVLPNYRGERCLTVGGTSLSR